MPEIFTFANAAKVAGLLKGFVVDTYRKRRAASQAAEGNPLPYIMQASTQAWFGVVYAALIASLVGHGLFFVLIKRHPVAMITPYLLIAPLLASILGVVFLNDHVGIRVWIGGALVLSGVLAIALRNLQKAKPEPPVAADLV